MLRRAGFLPINHDLDRSESLVDLEETDTEHTPMTVLSPSSYPTHKVNWRRIIAAALLFAAFFITVQFAFLYFFFLKGHGNAMFAHVSPPTPESAPIVTPVPEPTPPPEAVPAPEPTPAQAPTLTPNADLFDYTNPRIEVLTNSPVIPMGQVWNPATLPLPPNPLGYHYVTVSRVAAERPAELVDAKLSIEHSSIAACYSDFVGVRNGVTVRRSDLAHLPDVENIEWRHECVTPWRTNQAAFPYDVAKLRAKVEDSFFTGEEDARIFYDACGRILAIYGTLTDDINDSNYWGLQMIDLRAILTDLPIAPRPECDADAYMRPVRAGGHIDKFEKNWTPMPLVGVGMLRAGIPDAAVSRPLTSVSPVVSRSGAMSPITAVTTTSAVSASPTAHRGVGMDHQAFLRTLMSSSASRYLPFELPTAATPVSAATLYPYPHALPVNPTPTALLRAGAPTKLQAVSVATTPARSLADALMFHAHIAPTRYLSGTTSVDDTAEVFEQCFAKMIPDTMPEGPRELHGAGNAVFFTLDEAAVAYLRHSDAAPVAGGVSEKERRDAEVVGANAYAILTHRVVKRHERKLPPVYQQVLAFVSLRTGQLLGLMPLQLLVPHFHFIYVPHMFFNEVPRHTYFPTTASSTSTGVNKQSQLLPTVLPSWGTLDSPLMLVASADDKTSYLRQINLRRAFNNMHRCSGDMAWKKREK